MSNWQPIETAPKDGDDYILGLTWFASSFGDLTLYPEMHVIKWDELEEEGWVDQDGMLMGESFTHWMPITKPPEAP